MLNVGTCYKCDNSTYCCQSILDNGLAIMLDVDAGMCYVMSHIYLFKDMRIDFGTLDLVACY